MIATAKKHKALAATTLIGAAVLGGGVSYEIVGSQNKVDQVQRQAQEHAAVIRDSQVAACENSLKPGGVRYIIAQQIQQQITESRRVNYHKFFPHIAAGQLHKLVNRQRAQQFQEIHDLTAINCSAQYPKP